MLSSPEATAPPLALRHPHLPLYAVLAIGSCFAIGVAAYVAIVSPGKPTLHEASSRALRTSPQP